MEAPEIISRASNVSASKGDYLDSLLPRTLAHLYWSPAVYSKPSIGRIAADAL